MNESLSAVTDFPFPKTWTATEIWVWETIKKGEIADFKSRDNKILDPTQSEGWNDDRLISPDFIECILLKEPRRSSLPRRGFRISGARIKDRLDLSNARLSAEWWIDDSRFENEVSLYSLKTTNHISFAGSNFIKGLDIGYMESDHTINLNRVRSSEKITMYVINTGNLFLDKVSAKEVNLNSSKINGSISFD